MKLNLGCGPDLREGYVNVDSRNLFGVEQRDLSVFPWPWPTNSVEEILMLDFLEHFPYRKTELVWTSALQILQPGGKLVIQVPDLEHCARAALNKTPFLCNKCGWEFADRQPTLMGPNGIECEQCGQPWFEIAKAAVHRLYGGQDYPGNFHFTAFSELMLRILLKKNGFIRVEKLEETHQWANWNIKFSAQKPFDTIDLWSEQ